MQELIMQKLNMQKLNTHKLNRSGAKRDTQGGFTLLEIMISLALGLISPKKNRFCVIIQSLCQVTLPVQ
jgi:prepilin-type N-terminal cleavage/methylation domain-containing protein